MRHTLNGLFKRGWLAVPAGFMVFAMSTPVLACGGGHCEMSSTLHWGLWIGSLVYRAAILVLIYLIYSEVKARK